jgi:hypothetical protein
MFEDIAQLFNHEAGELDLLRDVFDPAISGCNTVGILIKGLRQLEPAPAT